MGLFTSKCSDCKATENVKRCPYCKKNICETCLKYIVLKNETPKGLVGKVVNDFNEFKDLYLKYQKIFTKKKVPVHLCDEFLQQAWKGIMDQVKQFQNQTDHKVSKITLK
ncbi:MAG: hypothetical protein GY863_13690 [bacterium]|nr:hypothetical protein [bacterium]